MKLVVGDPERLSLIGHSGVAGAVAFYYPQLDLYLTGTTDHAGDSSLCIQLLYSLVLTLEQAYSNQ